MREIRLSGSEGGGALTGSPYPYSRRGRRRSALQRQSSVKLKAIGANRPFASSVDAIARSITGATGGFMSKLRTYGLTAALLVLLSGNALAVSRGDSGDRLGRFFSQFAACPLTG